MNLPNKLTMLRILIIPIIIAIYYIDFFDIIIFLNFTLNNIIMCGLFIIASFTDFLDGYLARKYEMVTTFGKFADPLADKLLVISALLILMSLGVIPLYVVAIILCREFIVTGIRLVAVEKGNVIAASNLGKYKTASTMLAIIVLFFYQLDVCYIIGTIILFIALGLTIISGIDYFYKNRKVILESI